MFLVVEDDPLTLRAIGRFLEPHGEVVLASTASEGLAALESPGRFRGFVFDWKLPDGDGLSLARGARLRSSRPILLVTGHDDRNLPLEAGLDGFLFARKPLQNWHLAWFVGATSADWERAPAPASEERMRSRRRSGTRQRAVAGGKAALAPRVVLAGLPVDLSDAVARRLGGWPQIEARPSVPAEASLGGVVALVMPAETNGARNLPVAVAVRAAHPSVPIMILERDVSRAERLGGYRARVTHVPWPSTTPDAADAVLAFLRREARWTDRRAIVIDALARELQPRPSHVKALVALARGCPRADLAEHLGIRENTAKSNIRGLLTITGHTNIEDLLGDVDALAERLFGPSPPVLEGPGLRRALGLPSRGSATSSG